MRRFEGGAAYGLALALLFAFSGCGSERDHAEARPEASETAPSPAGAPRGARPDTPEEKRVRIAAGELFAGCREAEAATCIADELPGIRRSTDAFAIDRSEVTLAAYRACVEAGRCRAPDAGEGCNWSRSDRDEHPINCVDWDQAVAYCTWRGGRLPTEWEWERAARGTDGRRQPWGEEAADCSRAVIDEGKGSACGEGDGTLPVGSRLAGATPEGLVDLIGNVWEWTASSRDEGSTRVVRGGAYYVEPAHARASFLLRFKPTGRAPFVGLRCAQ